jgi:hypothetical protein
MLIRHHVGLGILAQTLCGFFQSCKEKLMTSVSVVNRRYRMALTGRQTLIGIVITYVSLLLIFKFAPPMIITRVFEIGLLVGAFSMLVSSALMKLGKLTPGSWWGRSATEIFWQGIGFLIIALGNFSHLVASSDFADKLRLASSMIGFLIFIVAIWAGRRKAKAAGEI